ncbi:MAG: protein kinase [Acidobacteriota bacterium]
MSLGNVIGQTLDEKYRIERELGRGGMGTVYLATHVGTGRPVAVKVIAPQFMESSEFVERFRREARAAGRLRHPNVVDVTDFGFSETNNGDVAYLVMEYLDGCTLGEILEEEKKLPLAWTIDILEQVCSAVHEAHEQGIIHRDLKPDNIWLEPNQRGGYTVKVLDFGIAKLEETNGKNSDGQISLPTTPTQSFNKNTIAGENQMPTIADNENSTILMESKTLAQTADKPTLSNQQTLSAESETLIQPADEVDLESGTAILPAQDNKTSPRNFATKLNSRQFQTDESALKKLSTAELTNVGAVLGTPLYMSPEQCRGEKLTNQSDIYALGVIAYQMLSGKTPFTGDFKKVMDSHKEFAPPDLEAKKIPKKVKQVIRATLAKYPSERPPTAQAFAAELRAQSEGIGVLFRRALEIYSKHLPKFLLLSTILYLPLAFFTVLQVAAGFFSFSSWTLAIVKVFLAAAIMFAGVVCGSLLGGTTTWLTTQIMAYPLKPVSLRSAIDEVRKKWKKLITTTMISGFFTIIGLGFCVLPGIFMAVVWSMVAPVVMMENLHGFAALKRSKILVKRSVGTILPTVLMMFLIPLLTTVFIAFFAKAVVREFTPDLETPAATSKKPEVSTSENKKDNNISVTIGPDKNVEIKDNDDRNDEGNNLRYAFREALTQIFYLPVSIIFISFFTIVVALLYLKTRQIGGESMQDLLEQFKDSDETHSNWQKRIRERIAQSGKLTSKL